MAVFACINPSGITYGGATIQPKSIPAAKNRDAINFFHREPEYWHLGPGSGTAYFTSLDGRFKHASSGNWE
jgi:hypothetical protein